MTNDTAINDLERWSEESRDQLRPLPASLYASQELLAEEIDRLFYKEWVCVGHVSELKEPGDFVTFDIIDKPVLAVCDQTGRIRAYSNVCRHRATVLAAGSGNRKTFTCPYHAWTYDLDGHLRAAPYMDKELVKDISLPEYVVEVWQGLVFVNLDPEAEPLAPRLAELTERMSPYEHEKYKIVHRADLEIACNWKVLVENFCESYHVFQVHKKTLEPNSPTKTTRVLEGGIGFNHHTMQFDTSLWSKEAVERIPEQMRDLGHLICVYPCLAFSIDPEAAIWLSVRPTGPQTLKYTAEIAIFTPDGSDISPELAESYKESTAEFMGEDKITIELVQQGLAARVGNAGTLHPWERTNWEFGHYLASKLGHRPA